jgi:hypothetical protein
MSVVVNCPSCGKSYELADAMVGRRGRCKVCAEVFRIRSGTVMVAAGLNVLQELPTVSAATATLPRLHPSRSSHPQRRGTRSGLSQQAVLYLGAAGLTILGFVAGLAYLGSGDRSDDGAGTSVAESPTTPPRSFSERVLAKVVEPYPTPNDPKVKARSPAQSQQVSGTQPHRDLSEHKQFMRDWLDLLNRKADVLATVRDPASREAARGPALALRPKTQELDRRGRSLFNPTYEERVEIADRFRDECRRTFARCRSEAMRIKSLPGMEDLGLRILNEFNAQVVDLEQFLTMSNISTALPNRK